MIVVFVACISQVSCATNPKWHHVLCSLLNCSFLSCAFFSFSLFSVSLSGIHLEIRSWVFIATTMVRSATTLCKSIAIWIFKCDPPSRRDMVTWHLLHNARWLQGSNYPDALCTTNLSERHNKLFDEVRYLALLHISIGSKWINHFEFQSEWIASLCVWFWMCVDLKSLCCDAASAVAVCVCVCWWLTWILLCYLASGLDSIRLNPPKLRFPNATKTKIELDATRKSFSRFQVRSATHTQLESAHNDFNSSHWYRP